MVVIFAPSSAPIGTEQERIGMPSICTVQAPHCAIPQPNFVPVRPITSRNTQRSGVSGSILTCRDVPLTSIVITVASPQSRVMRGSWINASSSHKHALETWEQPLGISVKDRLPLRF